MKRTKANQFDLRTDCKRLGVGLFNLAVELSRMPELPTQARREEMIKSLKRRRKSVEGRTGLRHLRKTIDFTIERIRENRRRREIARLPDGVRRFSSISPGGRRPVLLDRRPMLERLHSRIEGQIPFYFRSAYRYDGAGSIKIAITKDPAKVGVSQSTFNDWEFYSKAARFPKQIVVTSITVPNAWRIRVLKKGLANVGGLVTLDAQQLEGAPAGIDLYAATWIEQGRGYQVHAVSGFIAVEDGQSYHAETADKAVKGVLRKLGARAADQHMQDLLAKHGIESLVERVPEAVVTLHDARVTGSCEFGIKSWCNRTNLPYEAGEAPLGAVYAAYKAQPLPEARAAILHALRRHKKAFAHA